MARTEVRRKPDRGRYDRATIDTILDEALICHVGFEGGDGPVVIPTIHARVGDTLYFHGSPASRMLRILKQGAQVCVAVTLLDGIVLAKSHFNSSMNYRSAILFGESRIVEDVAEQDRAFEAIAERMQPGRWTGARQPTDKERKATLVVAVPIDEASAKIRSGGPGDDEEDLDLPFWSGVIPISLVRGEPQEA